MISSFYSEFESDLVICLELIRQYNYKYIILCLLYLCVRLRPITNYCTNRWDTNTPYRCVVYGYFSDPVDPKISLLKFPDDSQLQRK